MWRESLLSTQSSQKVSELLGSFVVSALMRYQERVGTQLPAPLKHEVASSKDFFAHIYPLYDGYGLNVSEGVVTHIQDAWARALDLSATMPPERQIQLLGNPWHAPEMSLRWLIQHELNHYAIGHFHLTGSAGLLEGNQSAALGIASRGSAEVQPGLIATLSPAEQALAPLCLELQTDHDASEIVLGAYSPENWVLFRYYAICILMVIFIIEREERSSVSQNRTHPQAATRLFMLLAYLVELPSIPAIKRASAEGLDHVPEAYLPSIEEVSGYQHSVVEPVFAASQILAEAVGLPELWEELGGADATFDDIEKVLNHGHDLPETFQTPGAEEWARLKPLNSKLLKMLAPFVRA